MTITTHNTNPKNDSQWARHRSITKDNQNVLQNTIAALKNQNGSSYRGFDLTSKKMRTEWQTKFTLALPRPKETLDRLSSDLKGTNAEKKALAKSIVEDKSGVAAWLGSRSPFLTDLNTIWIDFIPIFGRRHDEDDTTKQVLFWCYTATHFDLIYSKWGLTSGHKFFHWQSVVNVRPGRGSRQGLDDSFTDADDFGDENDM